MKKIVFGMLLLGLTGSVMSCSCSKTADNYAWEPDQVTITNIIYKKKVITITNIVDLVIISPTNKVVDYNKDNVIGLGYSICGRANLSYDRLDVINFNKLGLGIGTWATFNTFEPNRRWDFGAKINLSF